MSNSIGSIKSSGSNGKNNAVNVILLVLLSAALLAIHSVGWPPALLCAILLLAWYLRPLKFVYLYGTQAACEAFPEWNIQRMDKILALFHLAVQHGFLRSSSKMITNHIGQLARVYLQKGDYRRAEFVLKQGIDSFQGATQLQNHELAALFELRAMALRLLGRNGDAAHCAEQAKLYGVQTRDEDLPVNAWRKMIEAEETDRLAVLDCLEMHLDANHPDLALYQHYLANWYNSIVYEPTRDAANYRKKARPCYERALTIFEQIETVSMEDMAFLLHDFAYYCLQQKSFLLARALYERLLPSLEIRLGSKHGFLAAVLSNYAYALKQSNARGLATAVEKRAQSIWDHIGDRSAWGAQEFREDWARY